MQNAQCKLPKKKSIKRGVGIQHLIYLIITSFGLGLLVMWGFGKVELCNFFKIGFKLHQFCFLNDSKKMRNLI